ncbi:MAG: DUF3137 domain-containing protein [Labilibaculum sp.]|nr:DUF3137 domain-containing protein [Labilibaculum sp.]MBI9056211.1 DUF3137 domain-containing protein [Labilibaculum sp.]
MSSNRKSFDNFFNQIYPKLEELEAKRLKGAKKLNVLYKIGIIGFVILLILTILKAYFIYLLIIFVLFFCGLFNERAGKISKELTPTFKKEVIGQLLTYFYDDVRYVPRQRVSAKLLRNSLLFEKSIRKTTGDDYTECRIENTYIHFSEVQAYDPSSILFFNGIFIAIKFNKSFTAKTIVIPRSRTSFYKRIKMNLRGEMKNASTINLEDIIFNKEFRVIGEDQVESRYKLTTSLMQRMLDYKRKINKKVAFSLVNNWLYVSIPTKKNRFEASVTKPINNKEFIRSSFDYFQLLTGLVDDLDLNTKIWK